jgi:acetyl esterase
VSDPNNSGSALDPAMFEPASVPAGTLAVTEQLCRDGANAPALSAARIRDLRRSAPGAGAALRAEPPSEQAVVRVIDGLAGSLRLRVLRSGEVRACYLHLHGGGWALGGADSQDQTLLRFASAARVAVVSVEYRLAPSIRIPCARDRRLPGRRSPAHGGTPEEGQVLALVGGIQSRQQHGASRTATPS